MSYVKHILLPKERILYSGHVHPRIMLPGLLLIGLSAFILSLANETGSGYSMLMSFAAYLSELTSSMQWFYNILLKWQKVSPGILPEIKLVAFCIATYGVYHIVIAFLIIQSTELIVTDFRIIAKTGILTIVTLEMDKRRVAGVIVEQSLFGRIMGYGHVAIQGFTTSINGLPAMVNPHLVERFVC